MFRFVIACVKMSGKQIEIVEDAIIEATSFNEAAAIADANFPDSQVMVARIGRVLNVSAENVIPLTSGAS